MSDDTSTRSWNAIADDWMRAGPWAVGEAEDTYRAFQMNARVRRDDLSRLPPAKPPAGIIAAYSVNELADDARAVLLTRLLDRARRGDRVLIVEPLARGIAPWWSEWRDAFASIGGRGDEWRFPAALPSIVAKLDRAAGLDHSELTGRSNPFSPRPGRSRVLLGGDWVRGRQPCQLLGRLQVVLARRRTMRYRRQRVVLEQRRACRRVQRRDGVVAAG